MTGWALLAGATLLACVATAQRARWPERRVVAVWGGAYALLLAAIALLLA